MPEDRKDIYKSGIIEKYVGRPTTGKFSVLRNLCLAEFAKMHHNKTMMTTFCQTIYQIPKIRMTVS